MKNHLNPTLSFPTATQQDQLMADLAFAGATCERGITGATQYNAAQAWGRWEKFAHPLGAKIFTSTDLSDKRKFSSLGLLAWLSGKEDP